MRFLGGRLGVVLGKYNFPLNKFLLTVECGQKRYESGSCKFVWGRVFGYTTEPADALIPPPIKASIRVGRVVAGC